MLQRVDGGKHETEDGLYANNLQTTPLWEQVLIIKQTLRCTSSVNTVVSCQEKSFNKKHRSKLFQESMAHIICILALLCFAVYIAENKEIDQGFRDLQVQQDSLSWSTTGQQVRCFCFTKYPSPCLYVILMLSAKQNTILSLSQLPLFCRHQGVLPTDHQFTKFVCTCKHKFYIF